MISPSIFEPQLWYLILFEETAPMVISITAKKTLVFIVTEAGPQSQPSGRLSGVVSPALELTSANERKVLGLAEFNENFELSSEVEKLERKVQNYQAACSTNGRSNVRSVSTRLFLVWRQYLKNGTSENFRTYVIILNYS